MTCLDDMVDTLQDYSSNPIKKTYNDFKEMYLSQNKDIESDLKTIYDEILYFFLTDLQYGNEGFLLNLNYYDELELFKDVVAIDISKKARIELAQKSQSMLIDITMKSYPEEISNKIKRFVYSAASIQDQRYSSILTKHMIEEEKINVEFIASLILKKIPEKKNIILKISD